MKGSKTYNKRYYEFGTFEHFEFSKKYALHVGLLEHFKTKSMNTFHFFRYVIKSVIVFICKQHLKENV